MNGSALLSLARASSGAMPFLVTRLRYITFRISESAFEISIGGSVYDSAVGSDSFSDPGWLVEAGGYRETECELYELEGSIVEYLNLGAKITVSDESEDESEIEQA